jgi:hypothetical protein
MVEPDNDDDDDDDDNNTNVQLVNHKRWVLKIYPSYGPAKKVEVQNKIKNKYMTKDNKTKKNDD